MRPFRRREARLRGRRKRLVEHEREAYEQKRGEAAPKGAPRPGRPDRRQVERERSRKRGAKPVSGLRKASSRGARATVRLTRPGVKRAGSAVGRAAGRLLAWPLRLADRALRAVAWSASAIAALGAGVLAAINRGATTERVLVAVIVAAAGCLIAAQFVAYRAVEVGQPQYAEVTAVAPPPQTDRIDTGEAHAYALVPLAAVAAMLAVAALFSSRWRLGRIVSLVGVAGLVISLAIDLPKGLDAGTAGVAFASASATLIEGFYVQVAASAVLVLCGWLLGRGLRQAALAPAARGRHRPRAPEARSTPSVAGGGA